jgi:hypothetical protein
MWQFVEVRKSVVSDSCHVRRRVCRDAGDMSSLQSMVDDPSLGPYKGRHIPRREHIDAYKQQMIHDSASGPGKGWNATY